MLVRAILIIVAGLIGASATAQTSDSTTAIMPKPVCSGHLGESVAINAAPLTVEMLGGSYRAHPGWPHPGEARVDQLRYSSAVMLRSDDPRFTDFDLSPGPVHSRTSGCWFSWTSIQGKSGIAGISNAGIGRSGYVDGFFPARPAVTPDIVGYSFVAADDNVHRDSYTWIGVWNAEGLAERSRVVAFDGKRFLILATLPVRLGAISKLSDLHSQAYFLTLIGEGKLGQKVAWIRLVWP